jgi:hypothetical protein
MGLKTFFETLRLFYFSSAKAILYLTAFILVIFSFSFYSSFSNSISSAVFTDSCLETGLESFYDCFLEPLDLELFQGEF